MQASRPLILIGHGIRAAGAVHLIPKIQALGIPIVASWQAKDLIDNEWPLFMGCSGIYGNRAANNALHHATEILAIGNRLAIWNVGYEGIREDQELIAVSLERPQMGNSRMAWIAKDCKEFLESEFWPQQDDISEWQAQCRTWKQTLCIPENGTHDDPPERINSYRFFREISICLDKEIDICVDVGAACSSAFQAMSVRPPQRMYSSGGLGEMGCAIPASIGVAFATGKRVVCIVGDGGMMLNLSSLQTIVEHKLPIKIIVAENDGYLMIRRTQENAGMKHAGTSAKTGVSLPRFQQLAFSFGIPAASVTTWEDFRQAVPMWLNSEGPALIEYHMDPDQLIAPKLGYKNVDGVQKYAPFNEMSPAI